MKAHGSSSAKEMKNAIIQCIAFAEEDITQKIKDQIVKDKKKMDAKSVEEFQEQIGIKFHEPSRLWNASFIVPMQMNEE